MTKPISVQIRGQRPVFRSLEKGETEDTQARAQASLGEPSPEVCGVPGRAWSGLKEGSSSQLSPSFPHDAPSHPALPDWFDKEEMQSLQKNFPRQLSGSRAVRLIKERAPRWAFWSLECGELCYRVRWKSHINRLPGKRSHLFEVQ